MTVLATPYPEDMRAHGGDCCDMGSAAIGTVAMRANINGPRLPEMADPAAYVRVDDTGIHHLHMFVDGLQCANCIRSIEGGLRSLAGVISARVNMSTGRLYVSWRPPQMTALKVANTVQGLGYAVSPYDPATVQDNRDKTDRALLSAMAVSGFAAANVMLLSVSIWAGAFSDMGPATRDLFHWISAAIALPAVAFAGRPFFRSAVEALRHGRMNMDVPISLAVVLAAAMSLHQTIYGREHAYFDASISLLFFLLVGRYLDHRARTKARATASHLLGLAASSATVVDAQGVHHLIPARNVSPGALVFVAAGGKVPVDGVVVDGASTVDTSLVTGESIPVNASCGTSLFAGTINLAAPVRMRVTAAGEDTLLADIMRMVEVAERGRTKFIRIADRAATLYAPLVHVLALAAFGGWWLIAGADVETSLMVAVAVLIITCPCALGLAVPVVQTVAIGTLLRNGILCKSGDGLERLAAIDTVVFDKTGTLTLGRPELLNAEDMDPRILELAGALARHSTHPMSQAMVRACPQSEFAVGEIQENPGFGLSGVCANVPLRLGNAAWCDADQQQVSNGVNLELWFRYGTDDPVCLQFADHLRPDAKATVAKLQRWGIHVELLSGDRPEAVSNIASETGIQTWRAQCLPTEKCERLSEMAGDGRQVLMVGDGLNDAPALTLGHVSMSPATGAEISQAAADFVFQADNLDAVTMAVELARKADRRVRENIGLSIGYNIIAVPIAMLGLVTPLIAAIAMSSSSIVVTLNALRLRLGRRA